MSARLGTLALLLLAALALYGMQRSTPRYLDLTGPIVERGAMGEAVRTRQFDATVQRVQFARQLRYRSLGRERVRETAGVWAVVWVRLAALDASTQVGEAAWLGPDALTYRHTDRLGLAPGVPPYMLDPGLPRTVRLVFEIRPDQARGATLLLSERYSPRLDSQARIALDDVPVAADGRPETVASHDLDQDAIP
ncbi:hypothetical protein AZ16_1652 [Bordetella bronchiseptica B18-5 (C3)]|uniref:Exported protein n=1 Tax=Bordetella parapertussis (strain Bpp5) TaxID=1208660 RepID=K0MD30_BORPB|nr:MULTISPECIES: hypothetical protein [Bordetella]KDB61789.1 hypothetical protein AZ16_1652 [Bordetella bronchiseptica B18-5 (C3)]KDC37414.1 hypothetical protein L508_1658 [Bordetella bronchiseptica M435/02/3]KDC60413.1 hypothetical protein L511_1651 [Bordetella bronchiseptica MBORD595]KDC79158.1 hypothetical protein L514_1573 [Bordetella bronchiseptica MBORD635]CCJ48698.1 Putative exported protein [Bordetella parapertussis Bpp5]